MTLTAKRFSADDVITHAQQWMSGQHNVNPKDKPKVRDPYLLPFVHVLLASNNTLFVQRVIVLNWMQDLDALLQHFSDFSPAGSEIVFVHQQKKKFIPGRIGSVRFRQVLRQITDAYICEVCTFLCHTCAFLDGYEADVDGCMYRQTLLLYHRWCPRVTWIKMH